MSASVHKCKKVTDCMDMNFTTETKLVVSIYLLLPRTGSSGHLSASACSGSVSMGVQVCTKTRV